MSEWKPEEVRILSEFLRSHEGRISARSAPNLPGRTLMATMKKAALLRSGLGLPSPIHGPPARPVPPAPSASAVEQEVEIPVHFEELREHPGVTYIRERNNRQVQDELREARNHLFKELQEKTAQLEVLGALRAQAPPAPVVARNRAGTSPKQRMGVPVMLCSDWHVEESVDPLNVNGLNVYNLEIADRCIDEMADAFLWLGRDSRYDCREALIWLGGDLFSGYIHQELAESNFLSPVQAVVWLQERLERMLRRILAESTYERILVPCNDGNHGRLTQKMRCSTRTENSLEWLLYKSLAMRLADEPRLQFQIADGEYNYLDVYDQSIMFFHGDSVRYQGGVGGLLIPMRRGLNEIRKYQKTNLVCFGHFHQRLDAGDLVGNGSMIGINSYSMSIKASPEPRQQSWFLVDSERGKCLGAPIWFTR